MRTKKTKKPITEASIYALVDPNTNQIKYIGQTKQRLNERLKSHLMCYSCNGKMTKKDEWINSLLELGIRPEIRLLKKVKIRFVNTEERKSIIEYKNMGVELFNINHFTR